MKTTRTEPCVHIRDPDTHTQSQKLDYYMVDTIREGPKEHLQGPKTTQPTDHGRQHLCKIETSYTKTFFCLINRLIQGFTIRSHLCYSCVLNRKLTLLKMCIIVLSFLAVMGLITKN